MNDSGTASLLVLKGLEGNDPIHLGVIQEFMRAHLEQGMFVWWGIFFVTIGTAIVLTIRDILKRAKKK